MWTIIIFYFLWGTSRSGICNWCNTTIGCHWLVPGNFHVESRPDDWHGQDLLPTRECSCSNYSLSSDAPAFAVPESPSMPNIAKLVPQETVFFLCDLQTRFSASCTPTWTHWDLIILIMLWSAGSLIHGYEDVVITTNKMLQVAKASSCPHASGIIIDTHVGLEHTSPRNGTKPKRFVGPPSDRNWVK